MIHGRDKATAGPSLSRSKRAWCAILAFAAATLVTGIACDDEEAGRAFRDAAASSLQAGVNSIVDGIVDGVFAVFELGAGEGSGTGTSSTSSDGGAASSTAGS